MPYDAKQHNMEQNKKSKYFNFSHERKEIYKKKIVL